MKPHPSIQSILTLLAICVLMAGCYTTGGEDPGPVADIVRIVQEPALISPTDTVKFTMIVANKRHQKVSYSWSFGGKGVHLHGVNQNPGRDNFIHTDSTVIYWTPAGASGLLFGTAQVKSINNRYDLVSKSFEIKFE